MISYSKYLKTKIDLKKEENYHIPVHLSRMLNKLYHVYEHPSEQTRSEQCKNPKHRCKVLSQLVLLLPTLAQDAVQD